MKRKDFLYSLMILMLFCSVTKISAQNYEGRKLNIIVIGAHPDDCDEQMGGTAALFAKMGHHVKFVSVTNGDAGHYKKGGGALAKIRKAEAQESAKRLGIDAYDVLDNHDGELLPTLDVRLEIIREIRNWHADVVITHRPNDYHPDHRYTGMLVQDAAYMVIVPNIAPFTPELKKNPVFLYLEDHFKKPSPFRPDIAVDITSVINKKMEGLDAHESQMYEWLPWTRGKLSEVPKGHAERLKYLFKNWANSEPITPEVRKSLEKWYGNKKGDAIKYAESFQVCEYGKQPTDKEIRELFPMLNNKN